jgi:hypothetical protein
MNKKYEARVIVVLKEEFAKAVNDNGLQYTQDKKLDDLKALLAEEKASLTNVMRDFEYYVQSSDAHGAEESPIISWSRDATINERAKAYYGPKFVVTLKAGTKVMPEDVAQRLKEKLESLKGKGVVEDVRVDSMDPKKNPPIPKRYFN